jgi:hypothetical protein
VSRLKLVGLEIEGGWDGEPWISPFRDVSLTQDMSINGQQLHSPAIRATHVGEVISPPLDIFVGEEEEEEEFSPGWQQWLMDHWPNAAKEEDRTNDTCGYHIHVSMPSYKDYALLSGKHFFVSLLGEMEKVGHALRIPEGNYFWGRIKGKNIFCSSQFDPALQMRVKKDGEIHRCRYGMLNFAWSAHGTVEFRALPTFTDVNIAHAITKAYLAFTEAYLKANKDRALVRELRF